MKEVIHISLHDNVAVAVKPVSKGQILDIDGIKVKALEDIKQGHKIAVKTIKKGRALLSMAFP